ncbi:MAG: biosynthetic peptidoglycan transglycosylase [Bacteroidota bacterium]
MDFFTSSVKICALLFYKDKIQSFYNKLLPITKTLDKKFLYPLPLPYYTMLIIAEDKRFWKHEGVDWLSIIRAMRNNIFYKKMEGASTIQQQLVRIITADYRYSYRRKIKEILIASTLNSFFTKENILKYYLFLAYYGWRSNGLLNHTDLLKINIYKASEEEIASIIARLKYPITKNLVKSIEDKHKIRTKFILSVYNNQKLKNETIRCK